MQTSLVGKMTEKDMRKAWKEHEHKIDKLEPCEYGHFGCSTYEGGPCGNELEANLFHDDPDHWN